MEITNLQPRVSKVSCTQNHPINLNLVLQKYLLVFVSFLTQSIGLICHEKHIVTLPVYNRQVFAADGTSISQSRTMISPFGSSSDGCNQAQAAEAEALERMVKAQQEVERDLSSGQALTEYVAAIHAYDDAQNWTTHNCQKPGAPGSEIPVSRLTSQHL